MSKIININSFTAKQFDSSADGADFRIPFKPPGIDLPRNKGYAWTIALVSARIYNTVPTISAKKGNNQIEFSPDGITYSTITIPDGRHSRESLNTVFQSWLYENNYYGGTASAPEYPFSLEISSAESKFYFSFITPAPDGSSEWHVRFPAGINRILGYNIDQVISATESRAQRTAPNPPDMTDGNLQFSIHVAGVRDSFLSSGKNRYAVDDAAVWTFMPRVPPGGLIQISPKNRIRLPFARNRIDEFHVYLRDSQGRPVDLAGTDTAYYFELKQIKVQED